jgi:hypothetical protein
MDLRMVGWIHGLYQIGIMAYITDIWVSFGGCSIPVLFENLRRDGSIGFPRGGFVCKAVAHQSSERSKLALRVWLTLVSSERVGTESVDCKAVYYNSAISQDCTCNL